MIVDVVAQSPKGKADLALALRDGTFTVGRGKECEICLESHRVSRRHLRIVVRPAGLVVHDSSTNGTVAGGVFIQNGATETAFGAPILLGDCTLWVRPPRAGAEGDPTARLPTRPQPEAAPPAPSAELTPITRSTPVAAVTSRDGDTKLIELRREIHKMLLEHIDLRTMDTASAQRENPGLRPRVLHTLRLLVESVRDRLPAGVDPARLIGELADEAIGLGPLERFLRDPTISEVMVVDPSTIYVERGGKLVKTDARFTDDERVRGIIERIVTPLGRRIDESSPLVDARLRDGSRVNAVIRPVALRGAAITIRKFARVPLMLDDLVARGSLDARMARFLTRCVRARKNVVISGGTGSGKTTLLNVLSGAIPDQERIVTIEDAAELQLRQPHVVSLETRPPNLEGKGELTIRDLVRNALRMRPDRIVVGECRGGEALDMLQAMNTGHDGSMTTTHANSPAEAVARLETLVLMAGLDLPVRAIRDQIASSVHVVVQQARFPDGTRRVTSITEVRGVADDGQVELMPVLEFVRTGTDAAGTVRGEFRATGFLPTFLEDFETMGLLPEGEPCL